MLSILTGIIVLAAVVAIFATTKRGRAIAVRLGLRNRVAGAAPSEDVAFLLARCGGDRAEVARRIAAERERFPALPEADHHRRAIRRILSEAREREDV